MWFDAGIMFRSGLTNRSKYLLLPARKKRLNHLLTLI